MSFQFIGSRISVISVHDLRFEGTLYTVDPKESTVALQNVICYGTENRRPVVVPPTNEIAEFHILRAEDIKDIVVLEPAPQAAAPVAPAAAQTVPVAEPAKPVAADDVARTASSFASMSLSNGSAPAAPQRNSSMFAVSGVTPPQPHVMGYGFPPAPQIPVSAPAAQPGTGEFLQAAKPASSSEYDFESANARFQKTSPAETQDDAGSEENKSAAASGPSYPEITKKYDKTKSFFDEISVDRETRQSRYDSRDQRKLNEETFGAADVASRNRGGRSNRGDGNRGRGRGRGRGNRGGYRGGNRGRGRGGGHHSDRNRENDGADNSGSSRPRGRGRGGSRPNRAGNDDES